MPVYSVADITSRFDPRDLAPRKLERGSSLFLEGERIESLYLVVRGEIRVERYLENGEAIALHAAKEGSLLSEVGLFLERWPFSGLAAKNAHLIQIEKNRFRQRMSADRTLADRLLFCLSWRYEELLMLRQLVGLKSAESRLLAWLRWRADLAGGEIDLAGRMGGIGAEIGLTRESVYRAFARLEERKALVRRRGKVRLLQARR